MQLILISNALKRIYLGYGDNKISMGWLDKVVILAQNLKILTLFIAFNPTFFLII